MRHTSSPYRPGVLGAVGRTSYRHRGLTLARLFNLREGFGRADDRLPARFSGPRDWLRTHGYRIDLQTPESFVAARADQPVLSLSDSARTSCFPGP